MIAIIVGECPATHPFAYLGGKYCCEYGTEKVFEAEGEDCDGGPISITSSCCKDDAHLKCPSGYCKNSGTQHI